MTSSEFSTDGEKLLENDYKFNACFYFVCSCNVQCVFGTKQITTLIAFQIVFFTKINESIE